MSQLRAIQRILASCGALILILAGVSCLWCAQEKPAVVPPAAAKPQPLPFSHKVHTQFMRECGDCHAISADGWTMNYPAESKCMVCHATVKAESPAIVKLKHFADTSQPVPWVKVYSVPDFVYFSHRTHVTKARIDCADCHGAVRERDVLTREKPTSMVACINCHKQNSAPTGCRTCHDTV